MRIDVDRREPAEELIAEILGRRHEGNVDDEAPGGLLEDPPVRPIQDIARGVPRPHEPPRFRVLPYRADVVGDGHGREDNAGLLARRDDGFDVRGPRSA